jgi:hypothetical protein
VHEAFPAFRSTPLRAKRSWYVALAGCAMLALVTGCGSATAAPSTAAAATASSVSSAGASQAAYAACLREHGADAPTAKPTAKPTADAAGGRKGTGAIPTAAREACASLRPHTNQKNTAVEAFNACMSAHGESIPAKQPDPAASPKPTGTARFLHGLNPDNAQVAAALKACDSKLPTTAANG